MPGFLLPRNAEVAGGWQLGSPTGFFPVEGLEATRHACLIFEEWARLSGVTSLILCPDHISGLATRVLWIFIKNTPDVRSILCIIKLNLDNLYARIARLGCLDRQMRSLDMGDAMTGDGFSGTAHSTLSQALTSRGLGQGSQ